MYHRTLTVDKEYDTVDLIYSRQSQTATCDFSEICTYTLSRRLCLSFNVQMDDKVGKANNKWEWMHSGLSQCSIYSTDLL